ncbi:hypothetical protein [Micromonospora sp. NPDC126480]
MLLELGDAAFHGVPQPVVDRVSLDPVPSYRNRTAPGDIGLPTGSDRGNG